MENDEIGKKIKVLRKARGLTQEQLADKLQVKRATISNYEVGRRSPHLKELENIANALGVTLEYFSIGSTDIYDIIGRAKMLFENDEITHQEKAKIYKEIMKMYLELEE